MEERGKHINELTLAKGVKGPTPAAEGIGMLNLVKEVNDKTKHLIGGKRKTHFDYKKVVKSMLNKTEK